MLVSVYVIVLYRHENTFSSNPPTTMIVQNKHIDDNDLHYNSSEFQTVHIYSLIWQWFLSLIGKLSAANK